MEGYIDTKKLTIDELMGIINLYPWFGGARKELCSRMIRMGDGFVGKEQLSAAALFLPSRTVLSELVRNTRETDMADSDAESLIRSYIEQQEDSRLNRRVYAGAGDYFSQEEYDRARREEGDLVFNFKSDPDNEKVAEPVVEPEFDLFTETLAQIYAEQGYYEQAKDIYSKLILAYPEKNAYFAALIQKIDELN